MKNKITDFRKTLALFVLGSLTLPLAALADINITPDPKALSGLIDSAKDLLLKSVIPLLLIIATVIFIVAMVRYLYSVDANKEKMRETMLWTIISLAVVLSLWALVNILSTFFGTAAIPCAGGKCPLSKIYNGSFI